MAISAWINQLYSYNLLFARDVMTISNIPLDATTFAVYQILFHTITAGFMSDIC